MKTVALLPNMLTLANAGCGLLAISKAIDALVGDPDNFYRTLEGACWLIFLAMVFDALDGKLARLMRSMSDFGAQLDSLADALTFGVAPAILAKALLEHETTAHPRLIFLAAASFALMALLRLARFNLDTEHEAEAHTHFRGLPSPAAAGMVTSTVLLYLSLGGGIEVSDGAPTPLGRGLSAVPEDVRGTVAQLLIPFLAVVLPLMGLLMVGRRRYVHAATFLFRGRERFPLLVAMVFIALLLYLAPVPMLFGCALVFVFSGPFAALRTRKQPVATGGSSDAGRRAS